MIQVDPRLKIKLEEVRGYLLLLADPVSALSDADKIFPVRDDQGAVIEGALRYGDSENGPSVAVLGGIHMNEMAGVFALQKFHDRWLSGLRPKSGNIYVATGNIERALEFIDLVIVSNNIPAQKWGSFHATKDHFNYNRIPFDILSKKITGDFERHAYQIVKYVLQPAKGRVLDLHNTSGDDPPMLTMFMAKGESPETSISRLNKSGVARGLPIEDFIFWKPGPYNGMESIRSIIAPEKSAMPILLENGGGANPASFDNADMHLQIWLRNVLGLEPTAHVATTAASSVDQKYYIETCELYHPGVRPQDYSYLSDQALDEARDDTFILIRDWQSLEDTPGWSDTARHALNKLDRQELSKDRLDNFMAIKKGDILALGLTTGLQLRSPQDGVVMMIAASPTIDPKDKETFANIGIRLVL